MIWLKHKDKASSSEVVRVKERDRLGLIVDCKKYQDKKFEAAKDRFMQQSFLECLKNPDAKQIRLIVKAGLNPINWKVVSEDDDFLIIKNVRGRRFTLRKDKLK